MKYKTDEIDKILNQLLPEQNEKLKLQLLKNISSQEEMLSTVLASINHAKHNNFKPTEQIWNFSGFIMIVSMDLKTCIYGILTSQNEWIRRFNLRQACLIIYESINDLFDLLGKRLREDINNHFPHSTLQEDYNKIRSELKSFKETHIKRIKEIRNNSAAHKDQEVKIQIDSIDGLTLSTNFDMINVFDDIINKLGETTQKLINHDIKRLEELTK